MKLQTTTGLTLIKAKSINVPKDISFGTKLVNAGELVPSVHFLRDRMEQRKIYTCQARDSVRNGIAYQGRQVLLVLDDKIPGNEISKEDVLVVVDPKNRKIVTGYHPNNAEYPDRWAYTPNGIVDKQKGNCYKKIEE